MFLALGFAGVLLGPTAAPVAAAPLLGVQITRTVTPLHRGDERLVYQLSVENHGSVAPAVGDTLTCDVHALSWFNGPTFSVKWMRDSGDLTTPVAESNSGISTYMIQAGDAGHTLQCVVLGANSAGTTASFSKPITVEPVPTEPSPPVPGATGSGRPSVANAGSAQVGERTCTAPSTWVVDQDGNPSTLPEPFTGFTNYQWLRNGQPIGGATGQHYQPVVAAGTATTTAGSTTLTAVSPGAGSQPFAVGQRIYGKGIPAGTTIAAVGAGTLELSASATASASGVAISAGADAVSVLQCEVFGSSGSGGPPSGGTVLAISANSNTGSLVEFEAKTEAEGFGKVKPPSNSGDTNNANLPSLAANATSGPVDLELELPGGEETYAFKATSSSDKWSCTKQAPAPPLHATVSCTRSDPLAPNTAYAPVEVVVAVGPDAPDTLIARATVSGGGSPEPPPAEDEFTLGSALPFGFEAFSTSVLDESGNAYTQAGGHPFSAGASLEFTSHTRAENTNNTGQYGPRALNAFTRVIRTDIPPGFIGNPQAISEKCEKVADVVNLPSTCPPGSAVGGITLETSDGPKGNLPIYSIAPERGAPAEFAFGDADFHFAFALTPELRPDDGYAITLVSAPAPKNPEVYSAELALCGYGATLAVTELGKSFFTGCRKTTDPGVNEAPFLTNPTDCSGSPPTTTISADSWEEPGVFASRSFASPPLTGCGEVPFEPKIELQPTSHAADSPTGLDVSIEMPTAGLLSPTGLAQGALKRSVVRLPEGMSVNPASADGLAACTEAEISLETNDPVRCPDASKIGSARIVTPLLEEPLDGSVYLAKQGENRFGSLLALYLVVESQERGVLVKLPGKVAAGPTGRLTATFDDNPQVPFERVDLHFNSGNRAALITPPACGSYPIEAELSPWSAADPGNPTPAETVSSTSSFQITTGPGGGPCPAGNLEPQLRATLASPIAGSTSPFVLDLRREDGSQRFGAVDVAMPPGLSGYLKGIPYCPDAILAAIPGAEGTGAAQLASPSCPAASRLGTVSVGAGAGPSPFYVDTGRAYMAGPYKGAPLSIAIVTPAVAGPFDLGNVTVRSALYVDPRTAQITVKSDPIPTVLHGIVLDVRDIRIDVDRPDFTVAPTSCEPMSVGAQVTGASGSEASASDRLQVGGCEQIGFKPRLRIEVHGGTKRGAYQRLVATLTARRGDANIARAAVTLPHSEFLAQEHIRKVCTRVQFAAHECPAGSIYGQARAITPLLDYPLAGPVYLRSSDNPLPDLVAALRGPDSQPIELELVGRTDSIHGGIRNTFDVVPDAPVKKFTLELKGGRKSLVVNSRNLCAGVQRATVRMTAHSGKTRDFRSVVGNDCKKMARGGRR